VFYASREPVAVARSWASTLLDGDAASAAALLAGRPCGAVEDKGAIICSCFSVGFKQIEAAVANRSCMSVETVGALLKAGTNCGSCRGEIRQIVEKAKASAEADAIVA
jgi:assimilatory nitrate reductase catalytic subunit